MVWSISRSRLRSEPAAARDAYDAAVLAGDYTAAHVTVGEGVGLVRDLPTAAELIARMDQGARALLN